MIDCHCHFVRDDARHIVACPFTGEIGESDYVFYGTHPWHLDGYDPERLCAQLAMNARAGVGEIGLDRLKERDISPRMREVFASQLAIAAEFRRPVVLHGAKCWGEVVKACLPYKGIIPSFMFHGFSRSEGLLPDIKALNGFVGIGAAILNDHATNYRELAKKVADDMLMVESDVIEENAVLTPAIADIYGVLASLRGTSVEKIVDIVDKNTLRFLS